MAAVLTIMVELGVPPHASSCRRSLSLLKSNMYLWRRLTGALYTSNISNSLKASI